MLATTVGGKHTDPVRNTTLSSVHDFHSTCHHLFGVPFITSLQSNLNNALNTQNTTGNNCMISHAQNTTALQPNTFLAGIHRLLFTNKGRSAVFCANNFQGQVQTSYSVTIFAFFVAYTHAVRVHLF